MLYYTASGRKIDVCKITPDDIEIADIARSLSRICRFAGHTLRFYSVAQHSLLVSQCLPAQFALDGLLHDAAEAYVSDVPKPVKRLFKAYSKLEEEVYKAIATKFALPSKIREEVLYADLKVLGWEIPHLMPNVKDPDLPHRLPMEKFATKFFVEKNQDYWMVRFLEQFERLMGVEI